MTAAEQKILPLFNRCAIFSTTSTSYHGHPTPLACPPDRTRKSMATYYYSAGRPESEVNDAHSTLFKQRPGAASIEEKPSVTFKDVVKAVTPPFVVTAVKSLRK